jgi:tripartite-type tricarboxylate transporter receptor subunit TctC
VFDTARLNYPTKLSNGQAWKDIHTCKESGIPADYLMLRGIFMPPGVSKEQTQFYVDLLGKVRATPDWKEFMEKGAFNQTSLTGQPYFDWVAKNEQLHRELMKQAGFLPQ